MHPELRKRLQELGLGEEGRRDGEQVQQGISGSANDNSDVVDAIGRADAIGRSCFDDADLALQLESLDARCRALDAPAERRGKERNASTDKQRTRRRTPSASRNLRAAGVGSGDTGGGAETSGPAATSGTPRQHPLEGVPLDSSEVGAGAASGAKDFKRRSVAAPPRPSARPRPPPAPGQPPASRPAIGAANSLAATVAGEPSRSKGQLLTPQSARGSRGSAGTVALPPLKPSVSAPGSLLSGAWAGRS